MTSKLILISLLAAIASLLISMVVSNSIPRMAEGEIKGDATLYFILCYHFRMPRVAITVFPGMPHHIT